MLFRIHRQLPYGTSLFLTGSTDALSKWSQTKALPCQWSDNHVWTVQTNPLNVSPPTRFEFKFFSCEASGNNAHWEPGDNHAVVITGIPSSTTSFENVIVNVTWASPREIIISSPSPLDTKQILNSTPDTLASPSPPPTPFNHHDQNPPLEVVSAAVAAVTNKDVNTPNPKANGNATTSTSVSAPTPNSVSSTSIRTSGTGTTTTSTDLNGNGNINDNKKNGNSIHIGEKDSYVIATFRIKYHLQPGERIYILGSIASLGLWNKMHSPMLQNKKNTDFHEIEIKIPQFNSIITQFEYKYFTRSKDNTRRWEDGDNRISNPNKMPRNELLWNDRWEKFAIELSIFYQPEDIENEFMFITGDIIELGAWFKPGPIPMNLGPLQLLETDVQGKKWILKVWVDYKQQDFSYRYILINKKTKSELWEREPNRRAIFNHNHQLDNNINGNSNTSKLQSLNLSSSSIIPSSSAPLATVERKKSQAVMNSICEFKDVNFVSEMKYDAVPDHMFIGPYPQSPADIDVLAKGGVTAVLNVQTDEDFEHRGIQWDILEKAYKKNNIKIVRYQIRDFDRASLRKHIKAAAHVLNDLIHKDGKDVYIHCTAGMGRAPAVAVAYLCWVQKYELMDAVKHVKKYRTVAVPNVPVLEEALLEPF